MKRILSVTLRLCVLTGLFGFLIYFHFIELSVLLKLLWRPEVLFFGGGAILVSYATGSLRWWLLLRSQRLNLTYRHTFQLYAISVFSSIFIPGGTGSSDAVRVLMVMRKVPGHRAQALLAVFADRIIAVFMLSIFAAGLSLSQWPSRLIDPDDPMFWLNLWTLLVPLTLIAGTCAAWLITRTPVVRGKSGGWIERLTSGLSNFFALMFETPSTIFLAMAASGLTTALALSAVVIAGTAADIPDLSSWQVAHAAAISMFANGLPISPGGLGVGEAAFNQICIWITQNNQHYPYATIFLAYRVIGVAVASVVAISLLNMRRLPGSARPESHVLAGTEPRV